MSNFKRTNEQSIWMNQSPIICQQQNLEELILQKQKQLVLMEQRYYILMNSNNCLKQQMSELKMQIRKLSNQIQSQSQVNDQLNQIIFDLKQKIALFQTKETDIVNENKKDSNMLTLVQSIQSYKVQITQQQQFYEVQLNTLRFTYEQKLKQTNVAMETLKQQTKSQLSYYLNIIGEMQKQISILRQLNQFNQKNSSIQVKQLKFQKSQDSFVKSDYESLNLFEQTIKIAKASNNFISSNQNQQEKNVRLHNFNDKQQMVRKHKEYNQKQVQDYERHLARLRLQISNKKNKQSTAKIAKAIMQKQKYRNKSVEGSKIAKDKSVSYLMKYFPVSLKNPKGSYGNKSNLFGSNQIDQKLNMIKQSLKKQLSWGYQ